MNEKLIAAKPVRESNIELLRILSIIGVIILHYNNTNAGGGFLYVTEYSANYWVLHFLESIFVIAVDLFILISGYFMATNQKRSLWKPIKLLVQVIAFRVCLYLGGFIFHDKEFSVVSLLGRLLPVNYFVILYVALYFISPYINIVLNKLKGKALNIFVIIILLLFSVWSIAVDLIIEVSGKSLNGLSTIGMYGSQYGYTIVNFALMYIIGGWLRINKDNIKIKTWLVAIVFFINAVILMLWGVLDAYIGFDVERVAWEYCNPLVIANAVLCFILFSRINIKPNRVINFFAKGVFTVYLLHGWFLPKIKVDWAVQQNVAVMLLHIIAACIAIYLICFVVHIIYSFIMDHIFGWLSKKIKLPVLNVEIQDEQKEEKIES